MRYHAHFTSRPTVCHAPECSAAPVSYAIFVARFRDGNAPRLFATCVDHGEGVPGLHWHKVTRWMPFDDLLRFARDDLDSVLDAMDVLSA